MEELFTFWNFFSLFSFQWVKKQWKVAKRPWDFCYFTDVLCGLLVLQAFLLLLPSNCFASHRRFSSSCSASRNPASRHFSSCWYFCTSSFASNHFSSRCFTVSHLSSSCPHFFSLHSRALAVKECSALGWKKLSFTMDLSGTGCAGIIMVDRTSTGHAKPARNKSRSFPYKLGCLATSCLSNKFPQFFVSNFTL